MPKSTPIPEKYLCSITGQIMIDPVIASDGNTYEKEAIEQWLKTHATSPKTNAKFKHKKLIDNQEKHSDILAFLDSHPELYLGDEVYLPQSWVAECVRAIKGNQIQAVQRWLDKHNRLLTVKLEGDATALHLACEFSSPELVDALLKALKQKNHSIMPGTMRLKPVHLNVLLERALHNNDHAKCDLLLKLGAKVLQLKFSIPNAQQLQSIVPQYSAQCPSPLTFLYSNLASILPKPIIGLMQEYYVTPKEVAEFLKLVAEGEQDKAEAMLKSNPDLALVPRDVTDLSKRTFTNITGFQYAVWALDWHMWTMIRKYLPSEEAQLQAQGFETGSWIRQHGINAQHLLEKLVNALQTSVDLCNAKKYTEAGTAWVQQVGGAQLLLPAHVINEYCHCTRPFYPLPNFKDTLVLPRTRTINVGEWFSATYYDGKLGDKFAVLRGGNGCAAVVEARRLWSVRRLLDFSVANHDSVLALTITRTAQREELIAELKPRLRPFVADASCLVQKAVCVAR